MPSPPALSFDTYYHIYNRGTNRTGLFIEDRNYIYFLNLYRKYVEPVADTYAYCLLRNHSQVLTRIRPQDEIGEQYRVSSQFANFFTAYAKAINKTYSRTGSLFQHPFGRVPVDGSDQFAWTILYIHHNPQQHRLVSDYREWKYSSFHALLSEAPTRLKRMDVLNWFGGRDAFINLHEIWPLTSEKNQTLRVFEDP